MTDLNNNISGLFDKKFFSNLFDTKVGSKFWNFSWVWNPVYNIYSLIDSKVNAGQWDNLTPLQKDELIKNTLKQATELVISNQANSVEEVLQQAITQVEKHKNWHDWKRDNQGAVAMMNRAQTEVNIFRNLQNMVQSGKDVSISLKHQQFQYITQNAIQQLLYYNDNLEAQVATQQNNTATAAFGAGIINFVKQNPIPSAIIGVGMITGIIVFSSSHKQDINHIQSKQLT